ncbi:hypothetical protein [Rhodopirellula europaea]|uniref:hypothetical protein n=1 Tax=Rhodopirellula europaea TaxID=1263866 RepID=UPI003D265473
MSKQITIHARPNRKSQADQWVAQEHPPGPSNSEKPKRLTVDIDAELHRRLRLHSVTNDLPIASLVRDLIEKHLASQETGSK